MELTWRVTASGIRCYLQMPSPPISDLRLMLRDLREDGRGWELVSWSDNRAYIFTRLWSKEGARHG